MAFQMVYTSVRSGLVAGRSGFCTAARHREIKESLVARIEDFSAQYDRGIAAGGTPPIVYQHRIVTIRDQRHHVLMRLGDAGNDYTGRTNHIAHCLVVEPSEIEGLSISPAEAILALSQRGFWRNHYDESAQFFGVGDLIDLGTLPRIASLPAPRWRERTGSSANAALLFDSGVPADAGIALTGTGEADAVGILALFAESLLLLDPGRSSGTALWSVPFTTMLQSSAERPQFRWCGIVADSGPATQEARAGRRILSSGSPLNPPSSALADIAEGRPPRLEPAAAAVAEQATAGATDPREPALGSNPSADAVPERPVYVVPLSLEDPRRRSRATKSRKNPARTALLSAAVVISVLAMAGGVWFWSGNKEVWEEERRIGEMVDQGRWEEIYRNFKTREPKSKRLAEWKGIAEAIARYKEIEESPHQFADTVPGADSVDDAIGKIREEWEAAKIDSSELLVKQVEDERIAASESAKKWDSRLSKAKTESAELQKDLEKHLKSSRKIVREQAGKLVGSLIAMKDDCEEWSAASLDSAGLLLKVVKDPILPALSELEKIDREYQINELLKDPAAEASKFLTKLLEQSPKPASKGGLETKFRKEVSEVCNNLIERLQKLSHEDGFAREEAPSVPAKAEPPKPDPAVTAAAEAKKDKIPPKTILIHLGTDGVIDFSTIEGAPPTLPETFEIFPLSSLVSIDGNKRQMSTRMGSKGSYTYYDKGKLILRNPGELKLKKEVGSEFWKSYTSGFILRPPKAREGDDDVRYLVLDASETKIIGAPTPSKEFLKLDATGEVALSEPAVAIIRKIILANGDPPKYRLRLTGDLPLESDSDEDPSAIKLSLFKKLDEWGAKMDEKKKLQEDTEEARKSIETNYANLGRELFPQLFEPDDTSVGGPGGDKDKVDKKNPVGELPPVVQETFPGFETGAPSPSDQWPNYVKYVKSLFVALKDLTKDSHRYQNARPHIEKYIEKRSLDLPVNEFPEASAFSELTRAWSTSSITSTPPSTSVGKAKQIGWEADRRQTKYFEDFFKVWNERFNEEAVTKLINDLELIKKSTALQSPDKPDSESKEFEAVKSRLKNNDLSDDGEYTLELVTEEANLPQQ